MMLLITQITSYIFNTSNAPKDQNQIYIELMSWRNVQTIFRQDIAVESICREKQDAILDKSHDTYSKCKFARRAETLNHRVFGCYDFSGPNGSFV